jgi:hypothetical protein
MKTSDSEKDLDIWWKNTGFKQMGNITGLRYYWFNVDADDYDSYQQFVDTCDKWWAGLPIEKKQDIYNKY